MIHYIPAIALPIRLIHSYNFSLYISFIPSSKGWMTLKHCGCIAPKQEEGIRRKMMTEGRTVVSRHVKGRGAYRLPENHHVINDFVPTIFFRFLLHFTASCIR